MDLDQKKAEIAHKALYAFAFEGYHKTSLGAIARMCGIGRTTIYEYFRDKDEIFSYALSHSFDLLQPDFRQILQQPGLTSLERIAAILRAILTLFYQDKRALLVLVEHSLRLLRENREVAGRLRDRMRGLQDLLESLLREGMEAGQIRPLERARSGPGPHHAGRIGDPAVLHESGGASGRGHRRGGEPAAGLEGVIFLDFFSTAVSEVLWR